MAVLAEQAAALVTVLTLAVEAVLVVLEEMLVHLEVLAVAVAVVLHLF